MLNIAIGQLLVSVYVERRISIYLEEPSIQRLINQDVKAEKLEAAWIRVVCGDEAVVRVLQIGLQSYDGLLGHILDLLHEIPHVLPLAHKVLNDRRKELLGALVVILELLTGRLKPLRVLIEAEVCKMHVLIFDVVGIGFLVVVCAETRQTLIAQVSFNGIDSSNKYVETAIKLLLVKDEWVVDVPLDKILVMEC